MMGQAAGRVERFDHLLERQILVLLRGQRSAAHLCQQRIHRRVGAQIDAQRLGVGEQTDQWFEFATVAVGDRRADDHAVLAGQTRQQYRPRREQGHEQGGAVALARCFQGGGERRIQHHVQCRAGICLPCRAWPVGRQFQQRRGVVQMRDPEIALALQHLATEPIALPYGDVGVLQRERRQRIGALFDVCAIQCRQFLDQDAHRPAIGHQMVQGDEQNMIVVGQTQQAPADQWPFGGEGGAGFQCDLLLDLLLRVGCVAQVHALQGEADVRRSDVLERRLVFQHHVAAQDLVAGHAAIQRLFQRVQLQRTAQAQRHRHQIGQIGVGIQTAQEPQALLGKGQRQWAGAWHGQDRRKRGAGGTVHGRGQIGQARMCEQRAQGQIQAQLRADSSDQLHRQQRVSAEGEEVILAADLRDAEQLAPQLRQALLASGVRRLVRLRVEVLPIRCG